MANPDGTIDSSSCGDRRPEAYQPGDPLEKNAWLLHKYVSIQPKGEDDEVWARIISIGFRDVIIQINYSETDAWRKSPKTKKFPGLWTENLTYEKLAQMEIYDTDG